MSYERIFGSVSGLCTDVHVPFIYTIIHAIGLVRELWHSFDMDLSCKLCKTILANRDGKSRSGADPC